MWTLVWVMLRQESKRISLCWVSAVLVARPWDNCQTRAKTSKLDIPYFYPTAQYRAFSIYCFVFRVSAPLLLASDLEGRPWTNLSEIVKTQNCNRCEGKRELFQELWPPLQNASVFVFIQSVSQSVNQSLIHWFIDSIDSLILWSSSLPGFLHSFVRSFTLSFRGIVLSKLKGSIYTN